jgi:hypothetical protein
VHFVAEVASDIVAMRISYLLIFGLVHNVRLATASLLRDARHRHGTVADARKAAAEEKLRRQRDSPFIGVDHSEKLPTPVSEASPESVANVQDYQIANPTPLPAAFDGVYCRGGSCQYRITPPPPTFAPMIVTPPPLPPGGNELSGREFCRGLGCIPQMGWPGSPPLAVFNTNCMHLYQDILGGMYGTDLDRKVPQVYESFVAVCGKRVGPLEVGACPTYANTWAAATAAKVDQPTVGNVVEVCTDTFWWISAFKQAEIDLKLTKAALPKGYGSSLLAAAWNRFGSGGEGPSSPRGLKWREYAWKHGLQQTWTMNPAMPQQLDANGGFGGSLLQTEDKPSIPGADSPENTPRGLPRYVQNTPFEGKQNDIPQSKSKYQIQPGSPDGSVPPVEIDGDLFTHCANQFSEIMQGFGQTAMQTVKMTKGWCAWQASVTSWVGKKDEYGHPDWDSRTCTNMENFMAFIMHDSLHDFETGWSAQQICKKAFLAIGAVHRTDGLVQDAWSTSTRSGPVGGGVPAADDAEMNKLLQHAQEYANTIFSKLRGQKTAFDNLNGAKMDTASFNPNSMTVTPPPAEPDLPDSDNIVALLSKSVDRVREANQVSVGSARHLRPWGHTNSDA